MVFCIRAITLMRVITCNKLNYLFYYYDNVSLESHIPEFELSKCSIMRFYYRLVYVIYNMLDKDTLYEDN
ncbi:hypothetical protein [Microcystis phage LMM01]|uniref:Uncharacterized protein n=1 Tax=Microcystis phage LMM01 TaxID=2856824 RepID=A0A7Q5_9CAUD|nr:hypothetical protein MaLMM01_gp141 [Microcystis phage LMM01]BAF36232.1 hypothetical protein [Microcystis phage LMM01]